MKEKALSQEDVKQILNNIEAEKAKKRLKAVATITGGAAVIKGVEVLGPKAVTFFTSSAVGVCGLDIPNYFVALFGLAIVTTSISKFKAQSELDKKNRDKNNVPMHKLFKLED